jgi:hypothetical protein
MSGAAYVADDQSVADDGDVTNNVLCGRIDRIEGGSDCWISIDGAVGAGKSWVPTTTTTGA